MVLRSGRFIWDTSEKEWWRSPYVFRMVTFALSFFLNSDKMMAYWCQGTPENVIILSDVLSATLDFQYYHSELSNKAGIRHNGDVRIKFSMIFRNGNRIVVKTTRRRQMVQPPLKSMLLGAFCALGPMQIVQRSTKLWPFSYLNRAVLFTLFDESFAFVVTSKLFVYLYCYQASYFGPTV